MYGDKKTSKDRLSGKKTSSGHDMSEKLTEKKKEVMSKILSGRKAKKAMGDSFGARNSFRRKVEKHQSGK